MRHGRALAAQLLHLGVVEELRPLDREVLAGSRSRRARPRAPTDRRAGPGGKVHVAVVDRRAREAPHGQRSLRRPWRGESRLVSLCTSTTMRSVRSRWRARLAAAPRRVDEHLQEDEHAALRHPVVDLVRQVGAAVDVQARIGEAAFGVVVAPLRQQRAGGARARGARLGQALDGGEGGDRLEAHGEPEWCPCHRRRRAHEADALYWAPPAARRRCRPPAAEPTRGVHCRRRRVPSLQVFHLQVVLVGGVDPADERVAACGLALGRRVPRVVVRLGDDGAPIRPPCPPEMGPAPGQDVARLAVLGLQTVDALCTASSHAAWPVRSRCATALASSSSSACIVCGLVGACVFLFGDDRSVYFWREASTLPTTIFCRPTRHHSQPTFFSHQSCPSPTRASTR